MKIGIFRELLIYDTDFKFLKNLSNGLGADLYIRHFFAFPRKPYNRYNINNNYGK